MITELRLAGATTVAQAKAVLQQFLPRFNRRFGVPAQCPEPAFRPMDPESRLGQILCFKHRRRVARDNTVKYYRHTLQLLPSQQRRSYAGASVVVLEGLDGRLSLQHEGRIIASQEAPPSPSYLRSRNGTSPSAAIPIPDTEPASKPSVADLDLLGTKPDQEEVAHAAAIDEAEVAGLRVVASPRRPTFLQQERAGEMEGGAAGQASGDVHPTDGEGIGNSQRHGEEIHRRRQSAAASAPGNSYRTSF